MHPSRSHHCDEWCFIGTRKRYGAGLFSQGPDYRAFSCYTGRYRVHLANPTAIQKYQGLKHSDDTSDALWLAGKGNSRYASHEPAPIHLRITGTDYMKAFHAVDHQVGMIVFGEKGIPADWKYKLAFRELIGSFAERFFELSRINDTL